jgi:hypothetical protein
MSRGAGSTSELNRVGLVAVFPILTRELDSACSFLRRLKNSVADSSSKDPFQVNCESEFTVEVLDYQLVAAADADGCESFDLELE